MGGTNYSQGSSYLQHLGEQKQSRSAVEEACNSIAWAHSMAGLAPPTSTPFVKAMLEALQQLLAKPTVNKPCDSGHVG